MMKWSQESGPQGNKVEDCIPAVGLCCLEDTFRNYNLHKGEVAVVRRYIWGVLPRYRRNESMTDE